jgi:hypothetical protein
MKLFHECAMSSSTAYPSAGPTTVFTTTTPSGVAKPYSTSRSDEYSTISTHCPTMDGTVSKPWESVDRTILLTREEDILLKMCIVNIAHPLKLLPPLWKQFQLQSDHL